jgi:hypothetical protein
LALLGVAFYALLLPGHLTSQFNGQLFAAEFGTDGAMCASEGTAGAPSGPAAPASSCPICKGLAAFQLAHLPAPQILAPPQATGTPALIALREDVAGAADLPPRSRGPPSQV